MTNLILGAGVSGRGALALLFAQNDEQVFIYDDKPQAFQDARVRVLDLAGVMEKIASGEITRVILSPGVSFKHPVYLKAKEAGIEWLSEIDFGLKGYKGRIIAITGTNGKSTVAAMAAHILQKAGYPVSLGGNFGISPSELQSRGELKENLVLELSSYQLEQQKYIRYDVAVFLNLAFDHLGRHGSLSEYFRCKWRIFSNTPTCFWGPSLKPFIAELKLNAPGKCLDAAAILELAGELYPEDSLNRENAAFAIAATTSLLPSLSVEAARAALKTYLGLPYRRAIVGRYKGCLIINDSKATNVHACLAALQSQEKPCLLLLGGAPKGESFLPILAQKASIGYVLAFGEAGPTIEAELKGKLPLLRFATLNSALFYIKEHPELLKNHPDILFSPACASFDEFKDFNQRGEAFDAFFQPLLDLR